MSQELVKYSQSDFKDVQDRMRKLGLPSNIIMREVSFALQIINNSKDLAQCSKESILSAVTNIANIGLTLNPAAKEAYLISRWNNKKNCKEAALEPSYVGLQKLVMENSGVSSIVTHVVYENDEFSIDLANTHKPVTHKPCLIKNKRGAMIGAYSVASLQNGDHQPEWMDIDTIYEIRARSEGYKAYIDGKIKTCVWVSDESEMCRKTVIKRIVKYLPRTGATEKLDEAIQIDNQDYGATFTQGNTIEDLLINANISPEKSQELWSRLNSGMSFYEASEIIEFLKANQLQNTPQLNGTKRIKDLEFAVKESVENSNS